jgi:hypothetical protein
MTFRSISITFPLQDQPLKVVLILQICALSIRRRFNILDLIENSLMKSHLIQIVNSALHFLHRDMKLTVQIRAHVCFDQDHGIYNAQAIIIYRSSNNLQLKSDLFNESPSKYIVNKIELHLYF